MSKAEERESERALRKEFVAGLRAMADLFEKDGPTRLPIPQYGLTVSLSAEVKEPLKPGESEWSAKREVDREASLRQLRKLVSGLGRGRKEKNFFGESFSCVKDLGGGVRLRVEAGRTVVCKPVKTGRTVVHAAYTLPERVEEEVEWVCDEPLLNGKAVA